MAGLGGEPRESAQLRKPSLGMCHQSTRGEAFACPDRVRAIIAFAASCCTMLHMSKIIPPLTSSKPSRVSIPVSAEVLVVFERLAKASNMSTGRCMASWLADTVEAAELMASTMERARAAPKIVTAELHAMMLGMADQTKELADRFAKMKKGGGTTETERSEGGGDLLRFVGVDIPPSCNTGGKLPKTDKTMKSKKSAFPRPEASVQAHADTNGVPPKAKK